MKLVADRAQLSKLRRWFHQNPELSFHEVETAAKIMRELDAIGLPYSYGGEGGGIIARQTISPDAPTVALRAEMDALPGDETTGADYRSKNEGIVHACGHDAHLAMLIGAASKLQSDPPNGNVVYIFQPAEERGAGSKVVIEAGALDGVDAIFAGHVTHEYAVGRIMVADGIVTSQSDRFSVSICGRGGHAARPHEATDAVVIAGFLIVAIQTLVSREINPLHPSVVTIGQVTAGSAPNMIAETALLEGSIRTTRPEVRTHIHEGIKRMAEAVSLLHNAEITVEISPGYPPVINTTDESRIAEAAASRVLGPENIAEMQHPSLGSEDFSFYLHEVPGCFVRFGARHENWEPLPLHSPAFDVDERVLPIGAKFYEQVVREYFKNKNSGAPQAAGTSN